MQEISATMRFSDFTLILEKIMESTSITKKTEILTQFYESFRKYSSEFQQKHGPANSNVSFYPILRLLVPSYDIERPADGIKTKTMGKLFVRILAIDPNSEIAKRLTFRSTAPSAGGSGKRDYADIVYEVMKARADPIETLTIFDVNQRLDNISACYQSNNRAKIEDELMYLLNRMTAIDQKWLIRIMLERIRFGIGPQKIMSMFHPAANDLYARYSHLSKVCDCIERKEIGGGDAELLVDDSIVQPGQPFRPMLCQASHTVNLEQLIANEEFYLETKLDGERFQLHIIGDGQQYRYFSRKSKEYTQKFGGDVTTGTLTPYISRLFKQPISSAIFDGEMMVWNRDERVYRVKAENTDVKSLRTNDSTLRPCFCVYDVLHLNGQCLIRKPYAERVRLLSTLFKEQPGFMVLSQSTRIKDPNHILECLNKAIDNREEGVVIKRADSHYSPGQRNAGWFKIKPDYVNGLVSDFDFIVLGGFVNVQRTYLKKFLVGVHMKGSEAASGRFYSVATVSSGLSEKEFERINGQLRPHWNFSSSVSLPSNFVCGTLPPDVWIDPKKSIIFEIKASELVQSTSFGTKYTLRFPRIEAIRDDKMWYDCCSLEEYESLSMQENTKVQKLAKRHFTSDDINSLMPSKRLRRQLPAASSSSSIYVDQTPGEQIVQLDNICDGLDFCVLGTSKNNRPSVDELKVMIRQHGGNVVVNPSSKTFVCIAATGIPSLRVKQLMETKSYNIATVDWLVRALGGGTVKDELLQFHPQDLIFCTEALEASFFEFDAYGDSFTKQITIDNLKILLDKIELKKDPPRSKDLYDIEVELNFPQKPDNFYRLATAYFYGVSNDLTLAKLLFKSRGGRCIECIDDDHNLSYKLSHIMVNSDTFTMEVFRKENPSLSDDDVASIKFVSFKWIIDCNRERRKISHKKYMLA